MKKITQNFTLAIIIGIIIIVILATFVGFTKTETTLQHREKIYPFNLDTSVPSAIPVKITDIKPNSVIYFMYPPGLSPLGPENHFQKFMLIRLPLWMGGGNNDVSAFRAYSAVDLASHCLLRYWKDLGRQNIEDPCISPAYRAIDGISVNWPNSNMIRAPSTGALPMLDLSEDEEGYIYVEPPIFSIQENGAIGVGRQITENEFLQKTLYMETLKKRFEDTLSKFNLPETLSSGDKLGEVHDNGMGRSASYYKPEDQYNSIIIEFEFCNCSKTYRDILETEGKDYYGNFWRVGDTDIYGIPNNVDVRNNVYSVYTFTFYIDGFKVVFHTDYSFEQGMKLVLENYFPGKELDDIEKINIE